ncbi:SRPBCC domain-containing protein [Actinoplanes sp. NPDC024001]|uniref:SRPBCC family protein n=1 Tax=Actinoplanes sp. NPDC024001 TaxID=3154598 RepID=UPI0033DA0643
MTLEMRMTRQLPATPEEVFDAYTDAEKQKVWFSILDEEPGIVEIEVDLRVGGQQTAVWGPDRDTLFRETQTFVEIDRPHRLVTESTGSSPDGMTMTTRIEISFEDADGGTLMTVVQSGFPVPEVRDFFVNEVWAGAFARIEAYLTRQRKSEAADV